MSPEKLSIKTQASLQGATPCMAANCQAVQAPAVIDEPERKSSKGSDNVGVSL